MGEDKGPGIRITARYNAPPSEILPLLMGELTSSFRRQGWRLDARPGGSLRRIRSGGGIADAARIVRLRRGHRIAFIWAGDRRQGPRARSLEITLGPEGGGTLLTARYRIGSGRPVGPDEDPSLGWFVSEVLAPVLSATSPQRVEDWRADREVRRPLRAGEPGAVRGTDLP